MTHPISADQLDRLRSSARRMARQAATNENDMWSLLQTSQTCSPNLDVLARLCTDAREQRLAAEQLVGDLGDSEYRPLETPNSRNAVLVADDHRDTREWLSRTLRQAGFVVRTASNGLEAILASYELRPTIIVMDLMMPVLNGIEATRLIKAVDELSGARVIGYSAAPQSEMTMDQRLDRLFSTMLTKPTSQELLVATVQRYAVMESQGDDKSPGSADPRG